MDDQELWRRLQSDDALAYSELYLRYADRVFRYLMQRLGSRPDCEDLTAEVFFLCWTKRQSVRVDGRAGMLPWLLVCANNLLRNHRRSVERARKALARVPADSIEPDPTDAVDDDAAARAQLKVVKRVLDGLRPEDRDIIQLCVLQDITPQAVADLTGQRPSTIRSQLSRALARTRRLCERERLLLHLPTKSEATQ